MIKAWKGYEKGVNLGGWFSQCDYSKDRFDNFINKEDIAKIASWGLDHVRLPIDYNLVEDEAGNYLESGFAYLDKIISWCEEYSLNIILDLHKTYGFSFDPGENAEGFFGNNAYQERFYRLWEELSRRYGKLSHRLAFELLNEVTCKDYMPKWSEIIINCIKRIRAIAPDTYILIGGYYNNSVVAVKDLPAPCDDKIVYNFHCYDPLIFTHQGGYWVENMPLDFRLDFDNTLEDVLNASDEILGNKFDYYIHSDDPNKMLDADFFRTMFKEAIEVAEKNNVYLYCGEYGVINIAKPTDVVKWVKAINEVFVENNIGRAIWSYREMDFGISDDYMKDVIDELVKYL